MKRSKMLFVALAMFVLSVGVVACGDSDDDGGGGGGAGGQLDLVIGNLVPLTGDLSPYGAAGQKAGELALDEIDAAIKKAGAEQTVELVTEDGASDDQGGVQAARKLIADGATCISGDYPSTGTVAVARSVTVPGEVLLVSPASTADALSDLDDEGLFARTAPPDGLQGKALADRMEKELGSLQGKTINIGARNDLYGTGFADSLEAELEERGATVAEKVIYDPEQPSYNSEANTLTSGNPDNYVIIDFPETFAKLGPALARTENWEPTKTFITDGLSTSELTGLVGTDITEGMQGTAPGAFAGEAPQAFEKAYEQAPGPPRNLFDANVFDNVILCYLGAVAAGSTEGPEIAEAIVDVTGPGGAKYTFEELPQAIEALEKGEDIDYEGASGPIDWEENGDLSRYIYDISEFKDGELQKVDTVEVKADE
ncbi:MAG TPA: ABC transporter substrate-binding protein [Solirubrobacterales bacterium]|nr:ABC transporter substrate-binding protein [Solirubrobacterales bacterium]